MSYRGGGGGSRGGGRYSGRGGGGRHRGGGRYQGGGGGGGPTVLPARFRPCKTWLQTGSCPNSNCHYAHIVQLHANVAASNFIQQPKQQQQQQQQSSNRYNTSNNNNSVPASISSIAIWEMPDGSFLKIFTGSQDGFWRLWNPAHNFAKEHEQDMRGSVECLNISQKQFLFCGLQAATTALPDVPVGLTHVWNLQQPNHPPLELCCGDPKFLPYAHNQAVTAICVLAEQPTKPVPQPQPLVVTGSRDGSIRTWVLNNNNNVFQLDKTLPGHAREVTGLVLVPNTTATATSSGVGLASPSGAVSSQSWLLWSSSIDGSIRIWDTATGACQYSITKQPSQQQQQQGAGMANPQIAASQTATGGGAPGHSDAVTALCVFETSSGAAGGPTPAATPATPSMTFVLSASLDGTIKAWKATTGECVASEAHGEGVVCLCIGTDNTPQFPNKVLLIGLESGNIVCRNLVQTNKTAAFEVLFVLTNKFNTSHTSTVKCLTAGPQATFYSGGADGKLMVWQINGDLGIK